MVRRENRIVDAALTGNLMNSVSFYANTTIYIIAGLIAIAGTLDRIISITEDLPFARVQSRETIEAKLFLLTGSVHLRLLQVHLVPAPVQLPVDPDRQRAGPPVAGGRAGRARAAFRTVNTLAGDEFNRGIRAYYFGFAALGWFVHPALFAALTMLILLSSGAATSARGRCVRRLVDRETGSPRGR